MTDFYNYLIVGNKLLKYGQNQRRKLNNAITMVTLIDFT